MNCKICGDKVLIGQKVGDNMCCKPCARIAENRASKKERDEQYRKQLSLHLGISAIRK